MIDYIREKLKNLSDDVIIAIVISCFIWFYIGVAFLQIIPEHSNVENIYFLLRYLCEYCFFVSLIIGYDIIKKMFKGEKARITKRYLVTFAITFVVGIPFIVRITGYRVEEPGSFFEAETYTTKCYVVMSKKPETDTERKEYRLKADINRQWDYYGYSSYSDYITGEPEDFEQEVLNYHILKLYFNNGGYLFFDDEEDNVIKIDKECRVRDYKGDDYYITLIK